MPTGLTILLDVQDATDTSPTLLGHIIDTYKIRGELLPETLRNHNLPFRITESEVGFVLRAARYV